MGEGWGGAVRGEGRGKGCEGGGGHTAAELPDSHICLSRGKKA